MIDANRLLTVDAGINLILGGFLLIYPPEMVRALGLPESQGEFYPTILGAVLVGIAIALMMERLPSRLRMRGLGLAGAIAINLCGCAALIIWLVSGLLILAARGYLVLWGLALLLLGISLLELISGQGTPETDHPDRSE